MKDIHKQYFLEILKKYRLGEASEEEIRFLEAYYNVFELNEDFSAEETQENTIKTTIKEKVDKEIFLHQTHLKKRTGSIQLFRKYAVAATILIALSVSTYFILKRSNDSKRLFAAGKNLTPGGNKAILTLADGSKISLTDVANGHITKQAGITITKTKAGQLVYTASKTETASGIPSYNTIETPKGGQYQVILPDGTNVWLNAASSLRYPAAFSGSERKVELNGEAYFEVAKNPAMPFRIVSKGQVAEVLGTHFNINSYADEPGIKTTLLEGSVRILNLRSNHTAILKPGQQSNTAVSGAVDVTDVNPEQYIAWKSGKFIFADSNIESIMRQVSRWYNVDIEYRGDITKEKFGGRASRFNNVAELLEILELTDQVHFEINGRRIIVMP